MKYFISVFVLTISFVSILNAQKRYQKNYDINNQLISEGWVENNKKTGYWQFYYSTGTIKKEGHFSLGVASEYWRYYNTNGQLKMEGHFKSGKKNNWWLFYDDMEKVNHKCQLKDNEKNGYCLIYDNEKLIAASRYKADKKIKEWTTFASFKKENQLSNLQ